MKPLAIYHKSDLDGVCSAAIVKHFVPDCELVGMDYGDEFDWDKVRPGPFSEGDPLWADSFKPENGYKFTEVKILSTQLEDGPVVAWPEHLQDTPCEMLQWLPRTVYMVDFSLKPEDMKRLAKLSKLTWIDHHKTAIESYNAEGDSWYPHKAVLSHQMAACELCWAHFKGAKLAWSPETCHFVQEYAGFCDTPEAVRLLGRYDVFDETNPDWKSKILPFQYAIRCEENIYDPEALRWRFLMGVDGYTQSMDTYIEAPWSDHAIERGQAILRYQATVNQRACEAGAHEFLLHKLADGRWGIPAETGFYFGHYEAFDGPQPVSTEGFEAIPNLRAIACNTTTFNSQFFDGFYDPEKHDVMVAYAQMANRKWKVSMYTTKPDIDVGVICKSLGGGGHRKAAGFVCDSLPWEEQ